MLALIISIVLGLLSSFSGIYLGDISIIWSSLLGFFILIVSQVGIGLLFRKPLNSINIRIQNIMQDGQKAVQKKMNDFQARPIGSQKAMQKVLEKVQFKFINDSIEATKEMEQYFKWSFFLKKQVASMRMQFYFQMKNFEKALEYAKESMIMDPNSANIRLVLEYKMKGDDVEKLYQKYSKKFKGDDSIMIYAIYSWILIKAKEKEKAIAVLSIGKVKTTSEVLSDNWDSLINNKVKNFSNSRLGNGWYSLMLEEPKQNKVNQRVSKGQRAQRGQSSRRF